LYKAPRGTQDIPPEEQAYWRHVEQQAVYICQLYGYRRMDTPVFEDAALFTRSVGQGTDIVEKEVYTFPDRSGKLLTLRPEGTAPVCRAYLEHGYASRTKPIKLYYLTSVFRYDRPQAGRYRQHHQFGYEAIGDPNPLLDAEVIDMAWRFYVNLGLKKLSLKINSIGCADCRPAYLEELRRFYTDKQDKLCPDCKKRYSENTLRLLDCKNKNCQQLAKQAPHGLDNLCGECAGHFAKLKVFLNILGLPFKIDHRLVRGLDYYTKTVFEIQPPEGGAQSTLGGGGRYDDLIETLGGVATPALGYATGLERIILNLKEGRIVPPPLPGPAIFIAGLGVEATEEALLLAVLLRNSGIGVFQASADRSLKSQLRQANGLGARFVIIIGEEELLNKQVILRDMTTGKQDDLPVEEIVKELKKRLF